MFGELGRGDERGGVLLDVAVAGEPLEPGAERGEGAGDRGFGESATVEFAEVGANVFVVDGFRTGGAAELLDAVVGEVVEFAIVGAEGVWGCGAFVGERGEEVFGELGEFGFGAHGFRSAVRRARG